MSADDVQSVVDSGVAPTPNLHSALVDIIVGHPLAGLQIGQEQESAPARTGQLAAGPGPGPGPGTGDVTNPVVDPQAQTNTEAPHPSAPLNVHHYRCHPIC